MSEDLGLGEDLDETRRREKEAKRAYRAAARFARKTELGLIVIMLAAFFCQTVLRGVIYPGVTACLWLGVIVATLIKARAWRVAGDIHCDYLRLRSARRREEWDRAERSL